MTAAHCTYDFSSQKKDNDEDKPSSFDVKVGEHDTSKDDDGAQVIRVKQFFQHSDYNHETMNMDFCILELEEDLTFSTSVRPACLPQDDSNDYTGAKVVVSGWGTLASGGEQPKHLQKLTELTVTANNDCGKYNEEKENTITENMMCAAKPGKDSCQGDSGGPLVWSDPAIDGRYTLIGVVSFGYECALPDYPGVYARMTKVLDWVKETTSGVETCYPEAP